MPQGMANWADCSVKKWYGTSGTGTGQLHSPHCLLQWAVCPESENCVLAFDRGYNSIVAIDFTHSQSHIMVSDISGPCGVAVDIANTSLFVGEWEGHKRFLTYKYYFVLPQLLPLGTNTECIMDIPATDSLLLSLVGLLCAHQSWRHIYAVDRSSDRCPPDMWCFLHYSGGLGTKRRITSYVSTILLRRANADFVPSSQVSSFLSSNSSGE